MKEENAVPDLTDINQLGQMMQKMMMVLEKISSALTPEDEPAEVIADKDVPAMSENKVTDSASELDVMRGQLAAFQDQMKKTPVLIEEKVKARVKLLDSAKNILKDMPLNDMTDLDIKKAVIAQQHPGVSLDSRSEGFIDGYFESAVSTFENGYGAASKMGQAIKIAQDSMNKKEIGGISVDLLDSGNFAEEMQRKYLEKFSAGVK